MPLLQTALHDRHVALGARLVPFAGWEMPVQYAGVRVEHEAIRQTCGVFDVSHMGQVEVSGLHAKAFLQRVLSNDVEKLAVGGAQYSLLCQDNGGILDDVFTYRLGDSHYLVVTNASNHHKDFSWLKAQSTSYDVVVKDQQSHYVMLAVQGPRARDLLLQVQDGDLILPNRMHVVQTRLLGEEVLICGTGYTGEDGVELLIPPTHAKTVWDALLAAGVQPCGLGARDTLRLEVCYHLYGNDMDEARTPIEAGLGWACKEQTGFIGADAIAHVRAQSPAEKLVAFTIQGSGIARSGNPIINGGVVTSGTLSPSLGYAIGMAYLPSHCAAIGTAFQIDVRGRVRDAVVVEKPIYKKTVLAA